MWTSRYWLSLAERAIKSFCQGLLLVWPAGSVVGLWDFNWGTALQSAGLYAVASILTSIVSAGIGPDGSPSLVGEPPKEPAALLEEDDAGAHALDGVGRGDAPEMPVSLFEKPTATRHDGNR